VGAKNAKNGSEPEPKEVEQGGESYSRSDFDLVDFKGGRNYDEAHFESTRGHQRSTVLNEQPATGSTSITWEPQKSTDFNRGLNLVRDQVPYRFTLFGKKLHRKLHRNKRRNGSKTYFSLQLCL
jgi:hypothetical protein